MAIHLTVGKGGAKDKSLSSKVFKDLNKKSVNPMAD